MKFCSPRDICFQYKNRHMILLFSRQMSQEKHIATIPSAPLCLPRIYNKSLLLSPGNTSVANKAPTPTLVVAEKEGWGGSARHCQQTNLLAIVVLRSTRPTKKRRDILRHLTFSSNSTIFKLQKTKLFEKNNKICPNIPPCPREPREEPWQSYHRRSKRCSAGQSVKSKISHISGSQAKVPS